MTDFALPPLSGLPGLCPQLAARLDHLQVSPDDLMRFDHAGPEVTEVVRIPLAQWRSRQEGTRQALAIAFLRLQESLSAAELDDVFGPTLAQSLDHAQLLERDEHGNVAFVLRLGALGGLWILSDRDLCHPDSVMGASAATARIYDAALPEQPIASLLDLGCGGGALALAMSHRADHVTGTDISARAIAFAHANAALNASRPAEFLQAGFYSGVGGRRFSRIVCQPPFIPDCGDGHTFASGGPLGDGVTLRILRELPAYLEERGRAVLCVEWACGPDVNWLDRVRTALSGAPMRCLHYSLYRTEMENYCALLAPHIYRAEKRDFRAYVKRMLSHYRDAGITHIDLVLHTMEPASDGPASEAVRTVPLDQLSYLNAQAVGTGLGALSLAVAGDRELSAARLHAPEGFALLEDGGSDALRYVEFAPQSLLPAGYVAAPVAETMRLFGQGALVADVVGSAADAANEVARIRQMLNEGLLRRAD